MAQLQRLRTIQYFHDIVDLAIMFSVSNHGWWVASHFHEKGSHKFDCQEFCVVCNVLDYNQSHKLTQSSPTTCDVFQCSRKWHGLHNSCTPVRHPIILSSMRVPHLIRNRSSTNQQPLIAHNILNPPCPIPFKVSILTCKLNGTKREQENLNSFWGWHELRYNNPL